MDKKIAVQQVSGVVDGPARRFAYVHRAVNIMTDVDAGCNKLAVESSK